ncbi:MAG: nucleotidyl transferase AbiEii/AbiGii toxin family protein [Bacteroidaceae bacterium]|nr:nucleotidyl transferase AbiEii/AbiGii toxin family protein [Bacteroidaceae bacterium]
MLSYKTVDIHTLDILKQISAAPEFSGLRLVGGTSLALQYGHRKSIDLDFFGTFSENTLFSDILRKLGQLSIIKETPKIKIYLIDGIKVDFVYYDYPWLTPPLQTDDLTLATPPDIAAMKVNAIEGRGSKKDFIDLYYLLQHYTIDDILNFYQQKYPEHSIFRALMSMSYFNDADNQPMPYMFNNVSWEEIKQHIIDILKHYS